MFKVFLFLFVFDPCKSVAKNYENNKTLKFLYNKLY